MPDSVSFDDAGLTHLMIFTNPPITPYSIQSLKPAPPFKLTFGVFIQHKFALVRNWMAHVSSSTESMTSSGWIECEYKFLSPQRPIISMIAKFYCPAKIPKNYLFLASMVIRMFSSTTTQCTLLLCIKNQQYTNLPIYVVLCLIRTFTHKLLHRRDYWVKSLTRIRYYCKTDSTMRLIVGHWILINPVRSTESIEALIQYSNWDEKRLQSSLY